MSQPAVFASDVEEKFGFKKGSLCHLLNLTLGGEGVVFQGAAGENIKAKLRLAGRSKATLQRLFIINSDPVFQEKRRQRNIARNITPEQKAKVSASNAKPDNKVKLAIMLASPEHKAQLIALHKRWNHSTKHKIQLSKLHREWSSSSENKIRIGSIGKLLWNLAKQTGCHTLKEYALLRKTKIK